MGQLGDHWSLVIISQCDEPAVSKVLLEERQGELSLDGVVGGGVHVNLNKPV